MMRVTEPINSSAASAIKRVLARSPYGIEFYRLRRRVSYSHRTHKVAMALASLVDEDKLTLKHGVLWALNPEIVTVPSSPEPISHATHASADGPSVLGNPLLIGPVWEPAFANKLWEKGLPIVQQYPAQGYFLDIALVSQDGHIRLDIEVDGRSTHCDRRGRRKIGDVIRDARLIAAGWFVKRFWVAELMRDMDGCVEYVVKLWHQLGKGD